MSKVNKRANAKPAAEQRFNYEHIPTEVWLQILCDEIFVRKDIWHLSFTCPFFKALAQPLLFSRLVVGRLVDVSGDALSWHCKAHYEHLLQRLEYITSRSHLASAVTAVVVCNIVWSGKMPAEDTVGSEKVFEALFRKLSCLQNVRLFAGDALRFESYHFMQFTQLPHFAHLHLRECTCLSGAETLSQLKLLTFSLEDYGVARRSAKYAWWTAILASKTLRELRLSAESEIEIGLQEMAKTGLLPFRTLELRLPLPQASIVSEVLVECHDLENLVIVLSRSRHDSTAIDGGGPKFFKTIPDTSLSHLTSIAAPIDYVTAYINVRPVQHIYVTEPFALDEHAMDVVTRIKAACPLLVSLSITMKKWKVNPDVILLIFEFLTYLEYCCVNTEFMDDSNFFEVCDFLASSNVTVPSTMRYLNIGSTYLNRFMEEDRIGDNSQEYSHVLQRFRSLCPKLQDFLVIGDNKYLVWRGPNSCAPRSALEWYERPRTSLH